MANNLTIDEDADYGPAMMACLPKERAFVVAWFNSAKNGTAAAKAAGYGTPTTTNDDFHKIGHRTLHRPRVIEALLEYQRTVVKTFGPQITNALSELLDAKGEPAVRARVALALHEKIDPTITKIDANVKVEVTDHRQEAIEQLRALKELGVERGKLEELFGFSGLPVLERQLEEARMREAKIIEGQVSDDDAELQEMLK